MPSSNAVTSENLQKVLVYLFGSLGDSIVAIPALRAVRRNFPDAEIVLLQNFASGNIVLASQVIPPDLVGRYLSYNSTAGRIKKAGGFYRLWNELRREHFDAAVYLVISERPAKAVARDRMFFRSAGIKSLYGFHPVPTNELYPFDSEGRPLRSVHEAEFKLKRLERDGIMTLPEFDLRTPLFDLTVEELEKTDQRLAQQRLRRSAPLVSIAPGCKTAANTWPAEHFIELGRRLIAETGCEIIVTGGKPDVGLGEKLTSAWGEGINTAGELTVRQSAALLARCSFHIGLDTGTTHLAAAVGTRCFAIYGERNNPGLWYPLGSGHTILYHPVACAACRLPACPVPGHPCMNGVSVDTAWKHLQEFLNCEPGVHSAGVRVIAV